MDGTEIFIPVIEADINWDQFRSLRARDRLPYFNNLWDRLSNTNFTDSQGNVIPSGCIVYYCKKQLLLLAQDDESFSGSDEDCLKSIERWLEQVAQRYHQDWVESLRTSEGLMLALYTYLQSSVNHRSLLSGYYKYVNKKNTATRKSSLNTIDVRDQLDLPILVSFFEDYLKIANKQFLRNTLRQIIEDHFLAWPLSESQAQKLPFNYPSIIVADSCQDDIESSPASSGFAYRVFWQDLFVALPNLARAQEILDQKLKELLQNIKYCHQYIEEEKIQEAHCLYNKNILPWIDMYPTGSLQSAVGKKVVIESKAEDHDCPELQEDSATLQEIKDGWMIIWPGPFIEKIQRQLAGLKGKLELQ